MSELDERRIEELAKLPPRVVRGSGGLAARGEARKVLEWQALMSRDAQESQGVGGASG
ncbi:hypothetical protein [Streptomyces sp. V3I7]|uniref:hypothetical protein n=1 Tax=Streptomyces sp. V3I7 TaxID=3042278 RepID=UPI0027844935|nr:hypothetical protein [Streptomyces sp. V3I7]MDQ0990770.1 hypothetical protein [Streptomyces sp. V3I7]